MTRPPVSPEAEYSYVDKTNGRAVSFTPKPDEVMFTFRGPTTPDTLNEVVDAAPLLSVSQGCNLKRGFAAAYVDPTQTMDAAARALADHPAVANSIPAMIDENGSSRYILPDQFTVQFRPEVDPDRAEEIIRGHGSEVVVTQRTPGYYTLAVPAGHGLFETIREFSELREVVFAAPSEVSFNSAAYIPDDPDFDLLWGLRNTGQIVNDSDPGTVDADIDATAAWDVTRGNPEVVIAVIDTGVDLNHSDLQANILFRGAEDWDFADPYDPVPQDQDAGSHGTHVCGIIAAVDNGVGVVGVAHNCNVMPLRIDLSAGTLSDNVDAINYVTDQAMANPSRRYVMNCSWATRADDPDLRSAIQNAVNNNVVVVCAAGSGNQNLSFSPWYPGVYPEVISVAALDQQDRKTNRSPYGTTVDVAAPGDNILSTMRNNSYGFKSGTSMAASYVSGLAALIWSRDRHLTNHQVRQIIEWTCDNVDATNPGYVGMLGYGRINANAAVRYVVPTLRGTHTIQLMSNTRFMDAYQNSNDNRVFTARTGQSDDTQRWILAPVGELYTIHQRSSGLYMDADEPDSEGHKVVIRSAQNSDAQRWVFLPTSGDRSAYTIQQLKTNRFLDAHGDRSNDYRVVTRSAQSNDSQRWILTRLTGDAYTVQQKSNNRFLDAYEEEDGPVVTRPAQNNDTQRWILNLVGRVYTVQQKSNNRFLDAYEEEDGPVVTRPAQNNDTQRWVFLRVGKDAYTIQQLKNGQFMSEQDGSVLSRVAQNSVSHWVIKPT